MYRINITSDLTGETRTEDYGKSFDTREDAQAEADSFGGSLTEGIELAVVLASEQVVWAPPLSVPAGTHHG